MDSDRICEILDEIDLYFYGCYQNAESETRACYKFYDYMSAVDEAKELILRAKQEARLLTLEEVRELPPETLLWREFKNQTHVVPVEMIAVRKSNEFEDTFFANPPEEIVAFGDGCDSTEDYGSYYRLWTAKPTEEQRREEKWNE